MPPALNVNMETDSEQPLRKTATQLLVNAAESGQKLLRFLAARLELPDSLLHRWIRTGQIRLNGRRTKPFNRVNENDQVRLPPFLAALAPAGRFTAEIPALEKLRNAGLLEIHGKVLAWNKPPGLPVHGGSGHEDSLAKRLKALFAENAYIPAPAHRLDRDTTGIILTGLDWESQRGLQVRFAQGSMHKEYLACVKGEWTKGDYMAAHYLQKISQNGYEKMAVQISPGGQARKGSILVHPLLTSPTKSLLQIRLLSGIKHQIRVQLAYMGHPVIGDGKYGEGGKNLCLDAFRIILPEGHEFSRLPPWSAEMLPEQLPMPLECASEPNYKSALDMENE